MKPRSKRTPNQTLPPKRPEPLHSQQSIYRSPPKPSKSLINSPKSLIYPPNDSIQDTSVKSPQQKLKGLEEIGFFSEFLFSKNLSDFKREEKPRRSTINISDFMPKSSQRSILKALGGWETYFNKKKEHPKEIYLRDKQIKDFFHPSEKKPKYYLTPPVTPKYGFSSTQPLTDSNKHASLIDNIIGKCDEAISIQPPVTRSISPNIETHDSEKFINKLRQHFFPAKRSFPPFKF